MRSSYSILLLLLGILPSCDRGEQSQREFLKAQVPVAKLDSVLEQADSVRLPLAEARLLIGVQLLGAVGQSLPRDTMSIEEILDWARSREERERQRQVEVDRLAAEERARAEALKAQLDSVLIVAVVSKGFLESDYMAGRYDDYITLTFVYENKGDKDIRGFQGDVTFLDLFGDTIYSANLKVDETIRAGARRRDSRTIDYNQFSDEHQRVRTTALENMRVVWQPRTVIFTDGTRLALENQR